MTTIVEDVEGPTSSRSRHVSMRQKEETSESIKVSSSSSSYSSSKTMNSSVSYDESAWDWFRRVQRNRQQMFQNPITRDCIDHPSIRTSRNNHGIITYHQARNITSHLAARYFLNDGPFLALTASMELYRRVRSTKVSEKTLEDDRVDDAILASFSKGTGILFMDQLFQQYPVMSPINTKVTVIEPSVPTFASSHPITPHHDHIILDVTGKSGTAKTPLLVSMIASYVVATSLSFLGLVSFPDTAEPIVFIMDPEHRISIAFVAHSIRMAVIKRWNHTETLRKNLRHNQAHLSHPSYEDDDPFIADESWLEIEQMVASCLDRIHIIHPTSTLQIIATLELIRNSLDQRVLLQRNASTSTNEADNHLFPTAPDMVVIDSFFTCFEAADKRMEDLPSIHAGSNGATSLEKSGLSGRNDVVRQIKRLCSRHSIFLVASRTIRGDVSNPTRMPYAQDYLDSWNKLVTHRLQLDRVIDGSKEDQEGFAFVALLPSTKILENNNREVQSWTNVIPFIVTEDGIQCKVE